ncbi:MAG: glutathione S-transferase family protein [Maritimibacter sp.]
MPDYTLHYWPIPFRGHFIRYVLAHVGASWQEVPRKPEGHEYPFLALPLLIDKRSGQSLSQTPAILMSLGRTYDLVTDPDQTLRLICDCMDVLTEITRAHGAQMWDRPAWEEFTSTRLPRWMEQHEQIGLSHGLTSGAGHIFGTEAPTLADLTLAALWHTMVDRLPGLRPLLHEHAPAIEGLVDRIAARDDISAMLADWENDGPRYCAGQIEASILSMLAAQ